MWEKGRGVRRDGETLLEGRGGRLAIKATAAIEQHRTSSNIHPSHHPNLVSPRPIRQFSPTIDPSQLSYSTKYSYTHPSVLPWTSANTTTHPCSRLGTHQTASASSPESPHVLPRIPSDLCHPIVSHRPTLLESVRARSLPICAYTMSSSCSVSAITLPL